MQSSRTTDSLKEQASRCAHTSDVSDQVGGIRQSAEFEARSQEALQMLTVPSSLGSATFTRAAEKWLEYKSFNTPSARARFVSPPSLEDLKQ